MYTYVCIYIGILGDKKEEGYPSDNFLMGSDAGITETKFENIYSNFKSLGLNSSIKNLKLYNKFAEDILEVFFYILCAYICT
jgi:hypothetical protein